MLPQYLSHTRRRRIGQTYLDRILATAPTAYWPLADAASPTAGRTALEMRGLVGAGADLAFYGGFETAGAGGADIWQGWGEAAGDGALADETTLVHGGGHAAKLTSGASDNTRITNSLARVSPGRSYTLSFYTRGDGSNAGKYALFDATNTAWIQSLTSTGVTAETYTQVTLDFTAPAGCHEVIVYFWGPAANGGIAYFDDLAITGPVDLRGYYAPSGVTYGVAGIGDGLAAVEVDGENTYVQFGNRGFDQYWDGDAGSALCWGRVDGSARWTDAQIRYLWHPKASDSDSHYVVMGKHANDHSVFWRRRAGVGTHEIQKAFNPAGTLDWFCMGMTWNRSTPHAACYLYADGAFETVDDSAPADGMEEWGSHPVDDENAVLLAGSPTAQEWIGRGAHMAYWAGRELPADLMRALMVP
jgi:hypothetical protein